MMTIFSLTVIQFRIQNPSIRYTLLQTAIWRWVCVKIWSFFCALASVSYHSFFCIPQSPLRCRVKRLNFKSFFFLLHPRPAPKILLINSPQSSPSNADFWLPNPLMVQNPAMYWYIELWKMVWSILRGKLPSKEMGILLVGCTTTQMLQEVQESWKRILNQDALSVFLHGQWQINMMANDDGNRVVSSDINGDW